MKSTIAILTVLLGASSLTRAAEFYTPVAISSPNSVEFFPITNLIEGPDLGFDSAPPHNATGLTWVTTDPGGYPSDYVAVAGEPVLILDLGANTTLAEISVWGYTNANDNGVKDFNLRFATEAEGEAGFGSSITYNPSFTALKEGVLRQSFPFDRAVTARYVEFTCTSNYFVSPGNAGGDRVGLGEIAFEKFISPPEPNITAPESLAFAPTREVVQASVAVRNTGQLPLTLGTATISGPNATAFTVISSPTTLNTLQSGDVVVRLNPAGLEGDLSATLTITSNDPDTATLDIPITGTVPPPPLAFYTITELTSSTQDSDLWPASNLIQGIGVGFDANWPHQQLGAGASHRWVTAAPGGYPSDYIEAAGPPVLILDLGQNRTLSEINVWGYTATNDNGASEFQLRFATDTEGNTGFGTSIAYNPTFALEENDDVNRLAFPFDQPVTARFIECTITDNFYLEPGASGGDRVGLGEIAFPATGSINPTPPLVITSIQRAADTRAITLTFTSQNGKTYTVKRSTNLKDWTDIATQVAATADSTSHTDSNITAADRAHYYRVTQP